MGSLVIPPFSLFWLVSERRKVGFWVTKDTAAAVARRSSDWSFMFIFSRCRFQFCHSRLGAITSFCLCVTALFIVFTVINVLLFFSLLWTLRCLLPFLYFKLVFLYPEWNLAWKILWTKILVGKVGIGKWFHSSHASLFRMIHVNNKELLLYWEKKKIWSRKM